MDLRRHPARLARLAPLLGLFVAACVGDPTSSPPVTSAPATAAPEAIARRALRARATQLHVPERALDELELVRVHDMGARGRIVFFRQRHDGVEVYRGDVKVLLRADGSFVTAVGQPSALPLATKLTRLALAPTDALARAIAHRYGAPVAARALLTARTDASGFQKLELASSPAVQLARPARARLLLVAEGDRLVPAYQLELFARGPGSPGDRRHSDAFRYLVAADDGRILDERDLSASASFKYRVWADATGDFRPADGPLGDYTPHPTGVPDGSMPPVVPSNLIELDGFNSQHDPWLPLGATQGTGNNVDVYTDANAPDGFSAGDLRLPISAPGAFDYAYDFDKPPIGGEPTQAYAGLTEAFYTINWLHDWYYDSGFDEAAGDGQTSNYGRGGVENDALHIEDQDSANAGQLDNAYMITPLDGESPTMAVFICTGDEERTLSATGLGELASAPADLGETPDFDLTANVVVGTTTGACGAGLAGVDGAIALVEGGAACDMSVLGDAAMAAHAVGLLIWDPSGVAHAPAIPYWTSVGVGMPVLSTTRAVRDRLVAALANGAVAVTMHRKVHVQREQGLDPHTIAHEWGHYLHHRLADCGAHQCAAMSEGWGDFNALHMTVREGEDLHGVYGLSPYASATPLIYFDPAYFGLRREPYSVDPTKNAFTFGDISDARTLPTSAPIFDAGYAHSEVHAAGEVWAEALFEVYVALLERPGRSFAAARRVMSDYVVAGMEMTPPDASFTEGRDALLAVAAAADPEDLSIMASAFARRGLGSCAVSPTSSDDTFDSVVEDFKLAPRVELEPVTLAVDAAKSCDSDVYLDSTETATIQVPVRNGGVLLLAGTQVSISTSFPGVTFPDGASVTLPDLAPFASATATLRVAMPADVAGPSRLALEVTVDNPDACVHTTTTVLASYAGVDEAPASSATDDVEAHLTAWKVTGDLGTDIWRREEQTGTDHIWRGEDHDGVSDASLESPDLKVSATEPLTISFNHRYDFEYSPPRAPSGSPTYWDGGLIEISDDGGTTWKDLSNTVNPGYSGTIDATGANPVGGRKAYVGQNPRYPQRDRVSLALGMAFAGKTVRVRFRIGTDAGVGSPGWELDDLDFKGLDNKPFTSIVADASTCAPAAPDPGSTDDGCGCRVGGAAGTNGAGAAGVLLALAGVTFVRRRRRQWRA